MSNIEILKNELLAQKNAIEEKGGQVVVKNLNPSPSEITEGIKTISSVDMSLADAVEEDVKLGKTFYSFEGILKTGTKDFSSSEGVTDLLNIFTNQAETDVEQTRLVIPNGTTTLRKYAFNEMDKNLTVVLNDDIESIGDFAFFNAGKINVENFSSLTNLKNIGEEAFRQTFGTTVDVSTLPDSIETIAEWGFGQAVKDGDSLHIPANLINCDSYCFANYDVQVKLNKLTIPTNLRLTTFPTYTFYLLSFDDDLVLPPSITKLDSYFNHRGSFNNVTIPATCTTFGNSVFYATTSDSNDMYHMQSITFESSTPPTIGKNMFAKQHLANGLKIYVPDNAVEAYKALTNFTNYGYDDYVYPMSQKP